MRSSPLACLPPLAVAAAALSVAVPTGGAPASTDPRAAVATAQPGLGSAARIAPLNVDLIPLRDGPPKLYTFKLDDTSRLSLLEAFRNPAVDVASGRVRDGSGLWSRWEGQPWWALAWSPSSEAARAAPDAEEADATEPSWLRPAENAAPLLLGPPPEESPFDAALRLPPAAWLGAWQTTPIIKTPAAVFASNGFDSLWSLPPAKPIPNWRCRRRPVLMMRYGNESDRFPLVYCDGSAAPQALDRLTLMAREPNAPRPGNLLPDEPDPDALARHEWTPGVHLVHPRLLWVIQRIADAFPWRAIYVFSGYRHPPAGSAPPKPGTHHSMHSEARAMDIFVVGIPNAALFAVCHKLEDVGCGYYPNNKFVHVDVRRPGSGHPFWIDVSRSGEPSRYVDSWPGVIEGGGMVWDAGARHGSAGKSGASGTTRQVEP